MSQVTPDRDSTSAANAVSKAPARKRRRWGRRLLITFAVLFVLLGVLVGLAPTIVSQPPVTRWALGFVNGMLRGRVEAGRLSASWGGPVELRDVKIFDPDHKEVLNVARISSPLGVWGLITAALNFREVAIDAPTVTLLLTEDGRITLLDALSLRKPSPPRPASPLPDVHGRIVLKDGTIRVLRAGGGTYEVRALDADVTLATLGEITGKLAAELPGGKLTGDMDVKGLVKAGQFDVGSAGGRLTLGTEGAIDLAPLAAVLTPDSPVTGTATLQLDGTFAPNDVQARIKAAVQQLASSVAPQARPLDLALEGQTHVTNVDVTGTANLTSQAGEADAEFAYTYPKQPLHLDGARILSAVLTGESLDLPDFRLNARADIDLVAVEQALPGTLNLREGQAIKAGKLEVTELAARGGSTPGVRGKATLRDLAVQNGTQTLELQPINATLAAMLEVGTGLKVEQAEVQASFAQVSAHGVPSDLNAKFSGDLTRLQNDLGAIFDLGGAQLAGGIRGTASLRRGSNEQFDVVADVAAQNLRYQQGDKLLDLPLATVTHAGQITLSDGAPARIVSTATGINLADQVVLAADGAYDMQTGAANANIRVTKADLAFLTTKATALTGASVGALSGDAALEAQFKRAANEQPLTSAGKLTVKRLAVDGEVLGERDTVLAWVDSAVAPGFQTVAVESANLDSEFATVAAKGIRVDLAQVADVNASLDAQADLAKVMTLVGRLAKLEQPPQVAGTLTLHTTAGAQGSKVGLQGQGRIAGLVIGVGSEPIRQDAVALTFDAELDPQAERIALTQAKLTAEALGAELSGEITQYRSGALLNLKGHYDAQWVQITRLLHELAPATEGSITVAGTSSSDFTVTGPASKPEVVPTYRGVAGATQVAWSSAGVYGVALGDAQLAPKLTDGKLNVPLAAVSASGGQVQLGGTVDLTTPEPTYLLPGRNELIRNVSVNKLFADAVLTYLNPIFGQLTKIDGTMTLVTEDLNFPLGDSLKTQASGRGRLEMNNVKIQPAGLLGELLALGGLGLADLYTTSISGCDFVIQDGRLSYQDLTLTFPGDFALQFRGSVGFDGTLDLIVAVPISAPLLERLGVRGPVVEYARALTGGKIEVPIAGTRENPRLDLSKVDTKKLLENVVKQGAQEELKGAIQGLLGGGSGNKPDEEKPGDKPRRPRMPRLPGGKKDPP